MEIRLVGVLKHERDKSFFQSIEASIPSSSGICSSLAAEIVVAEALAGAVVSSGVDSRRCTREFGGT